MSGAPPRPPKPAKPSKPARATSGDAGGAPTEDEVPDVVTPKSPVVAPASPTAPLPPALTVQVPDETFVAPASPSSPTPRSRPPPSTPKYASLTRALSDELDPTELGMDDSVKKRLPRPGKLAKVFGAADANEQKKLEEEERKLALAKLGYEVPKAVEPKLTDASSLDKLNVFYLLSEHENIGKGSVPSTPMSKSDRMFSEQKGGNKGEVASGWLQVRFGFKQIITGADDEIVIHTGIYSCEKKQYLSDDFVIRPSISRAGLTAGTQELDCLFTDLRTEDLQTELKFIVRVYWRGSDDEKKDEDGTLHFGQFQRPLGVAVVNLDPNLFKYLSSKPPLTMKNVEAATLFEASKNERDFLSLHHQILAKAKLKEVPKSSIQCEVGFFPKSMESAPAEIADYATLTQVPRIGVLDLKPGEERHCLFLTLVGADVQPSFKNVGVRISVRNAKKEPITGCLSRGINLTAPKLPFLKSSIYYGTNTPIWNERMTLHLPRASQILSDWHLWIELVQENAKDHLIFSFAFLPLIQPDTHALPKNQVHTLPCYKFSRKHPEVMDGYLTYNAQQKQSRITPDKLLVETTVSSTVVCDDPDLYKIINWSQVPIDTLLDVLDRCVTKPGPALIGVHKVLLDGFFDMLNAKKIMSAQPILPVDGPFPDCTAFSCEDAVLSVCSFILSFLASPRATENLDDFLDPPTEHKAAVPELPRQAAHVHVRESSISSMKMALPKAREPSMANLMQVVEKDPMAAENRAKALEKKKQELAAKWKDIIEYYVDYCSASTAHRPLMYYMAAMCQWALGPKAATLSAMALQTHPRAASLRRMTEAFDYLWRLTLNSAKADLMKKNGGTLTIKLFKDRMLTVLGLLGRFMAGDRHIEEGTNADPAFVDWLTTQRITLISHIPVLVLRSQLILVPAGVFSSGELCQVFLDMMAQFPDVREEASRSRVLGVLRVLVRDGYAHVGSCWRQPLFRLCFQVARTFFDLDLDNQKRMMCVPLIADLAQLLLGDSFSPLTPSVPATWEQKMQNDTTEDESGFVETMTQELAVFIPDLVQMITTIKPEMTLTAEFFGPTQPKQELNLLKETSTLFVGLICLVWTPERLGQMVEFFIPDDGPNAFAWICRAFTQLLTTSAYPKFWVALRLKEVNAAVHVLNTSFSHVKGMSRDAENRLESVQAWMQLALAVLMDPVVNPAEMIKEEGKREFLLHFEADYRDTIAGNFLMLAPRVVDLHVQLLPPLIDALLRAVVNKKPSVNQMVTVVFRQFLNSELKTTKSCEATLSLSMDSAAKFVREVSKKGQHQQVEHLRTFFTSAISAVAKEWQEETKNFETRVLQLLSQLTTLESMSNTPQNEDERASAAVKLIQVLKDSGKDEVLQVYLDFLQDLHSSLNNNIEQGNVLMWEQSLLSWSPQQMGRKIKLLEQAIAVFEQVQWWEKCVQCCAILQEGYNELMLMDASSAQLRIQAGFQDSMCTKERIFPAFYRVQLLGNGFGSREGQEFVYRSGVGRDLEGVRDFTLRMQEKFKNANVVNSADLIPEERLVGSETKVVQITTLTPSSREEMANKPHKKDHLRGRVSPRVLAYYNQCDTDVFTYTRVISQNKDKNANEFKDLWLMKTYLITEEVLPGMKRCAVVTKRVEVKRAPIESAVVNIVTKNRELEDLIWKMQNESVTEAKKMHGPLSMNLSGVIDAAVQGGVDKYRDAFFSGSYLEANPDHKTFVVQFAVAMEHQLSILDKGLKLFTAQCDDTLKPLTLHLSTRLQMMSASVRKDIIPHGIKHNKQKPEKK